MSDQSPARHRLPFATCCCLVIQRIDVILQFDRLRWLILSWVLLMTSVSYIAVQANEVLLSPTENEPPEVAKSDWEGVHGKSLRLSASITDLTIANGGALLCLYFAAREKVEIFDVAKGEFVASIPAAGSPLSLAGGRDFLIISRNGTLLERWNLKNLKQVPDAIQKLALEENEFVQALTLGADSTGPLIVHLNRHGLPKPMSVACQWLDPQSFRPMEEFPEIPGVVTPEDQFWMSSNGRVVIGTRGGNNGRPAFVLQGKAVQLLDVPAPRESIYSLPSFDGQYIFNGGDPEQNRNVVTVGAWQRAAPVRDPRAPAGTANLPHIATSPVVRKVCYTSLLFMPAVNDTAFFCLSASSRTRQVGGTTQLCCVGQMPNIDTLYNVANLGIMIGTKPDGYGALTIDKQIHFFPKLNRVVSIPYPGEIVVHPLEMKSAMVPAKVVFSVLQTQVPTLKAGAERLIPVKIANSVGVIRYKEMGTGVQHELNPKSPIIEISGEKTVGEHQVMVEIEDESHYPIWLNVQFKVR